MSEKNKEKEITYDFMSNKKSLDEPTPENIRDAVAKTASGEYEFIILTPSKPIHNIGFMQVTAEGLEEGMIEVEIALENEDGRLYYKRCKPEECAEICIRFTEGNFNPDMIEYKPLQFLWNYNV